MISIETQVTFFDLNIFNNNISVEVATAGETCRSPIYETQVAWTPSTYDSRRKSRRPGRNLRSGTWEKTKIALQSTAHSAE